ncbi:G patch domain protein [Quillaja saponaria]|uniref:G patch domain protein n=1 Tax=Quillaja saponaria TaxID=32244 RepID=A0AAD7KWY2_QUISA|nr:G patch domain protein [Quillaja saponaria]
MMAVDLHGGELLLPSQFLTDSDDDILFDKNKNTSKLLNNESSLKTRTRMLSHGFGSQLSPLVVHSTEPKEEDNNEDFIVDLTSKMAHYMFQEDDNQPLTSIGSENAEMSWSLVNSPQSTLWPPLGSPDGRSQEASPPAMPLNGKGTCWEFPSNLVGKIDKMNLNDKGRSQFHQGHSIPNLKNSNVGLSSDPALTDDQIRAIQLLRLKQEQFLKQKNRAYWERQAKMSKQSELKEKTPQFHYRGRDNGFGSDNGQRARPLGLSSSKTVPSLQQFQSQQQSGSGTKAVFLSSSVSRSGSGGTGVFLPRGTSSSSQSRKKPGCSPVLIPARVVQALQLHFDQMGVTSRAKAGGLPPLHDVLVNNRDGMYSLQKRQSRKVRASNHNETSLPQEWTY